MLVYIQNFICHITGLLLKTDIKLWVPLTTKKEKHAARRTFASDDIVTMYWTEWLSTIFFEMVIYYLGYTMLLKICYYVLLFGFSPLFCFNVIAVGTHFRWVVCNFLNNILRDFVLINSSVNEIGDSFFSWKLKLTIFYLKATIYHLW